MTSTALRPICQAQDPGRSLKQQSSVLAMRSTLRLPQSSCTGRLQYSRLHVVKAEYPRSPGEDLLSRNRGKLRLFLDTADESVYERWLPTGSFYGVTTNPLLLERAGVRCSVDRLAELTREALDQGAHEVQLQAWGHTAEQIERIGTDLAYIDKRVVVKIPITKAGIEAAHNLVSRGIRVTMTGVYAQSQILLAASVGAEYAAPYLGRINAKGRDGESEIADMQEILENMDSDLRILVASLKSTQQITTLAREGITSFTLPVDLVEELFFNSDTEKASEDFLAAVPTPTTKWDDQREEDAVADGGGEDEDDEDEDDDEEDLDENEDDTHDVGRDRRRYAEEVEFEVVAVDGRRLAAP